MSQNEIQKAPPVIVPGSQGQVPESAAAPGANDAGHAPPEGVLHEPTTTFEGLEDGGNAPPLPPREAIAPTPPPEQATAADMAAVQAQNDFDAEKKRRIEATAEALQQQGVMVDAGRIGSLTYVVAAKDDVSLQAALTKAMVEESKRLAVKEFGGDGGASVNEGGLVRSGDDISLPQMTDGWRCPNCKATNSYANKANDAKLYESCAMCASVYDKHVVSARYDINLPGNQQQQQEAQ